MNIVIVENGVIPALKYGGTQRVIWYLGKELSQMGHQVTFLAKKGSSCPFAKIIEMDPQKSVGSQIPDSADIVHLHSMSPDEVRKPYIVTMHGNGSGPCDRNTVFVSRNHASRFGCDSFVYNGLDWDDYGIVDLSKKRSGYHFLGKAAWKVKNLKGAIAVTEALKNEHLEVLGGYRFNFKMGWRFTFNPRIHFGGMVDDARKKMIIERSKGLLFPVTWNEPFGLAIIESLYLGSPVFATPYGSLPELVTSEVGFLTNRAATMVDHLKSDPTYSPQLCHEYARDKFNSKRMALEYLKKYEQVLNGQVLISGDALPVIENNNHFLWEK